MSALRQPLWTSEEAVRATGGRTTTAWQATGVSIDSRTLERGDLFVAIEGPRLDGHRFVTDAFVRGAAAAAVSCVARDDAGLPLLIVPDTQLALEALGRAARARSRAKVIAVTGSVGKTGTKEALKLVLERQGPTAANLASLNNRWGVPLSLARMPRDAAYGVFELALDRPGGLAPLSRLVNPDVAVITTVSAAHTEYFDTVMDVAYGKAEIFAGMRGGTAVLNRDNPFFPILLVSAYAAGIERVISFGAHPEAQARLLAYKPDGFGSLVSARIEGREIRYRLGTPGRHWALNSLAVLAAARAVGADLELAAAALAELAASAGRGRRHHITLPGGSFTLIDDSHSASPSSMRAAFEILSATEPGPGGRRIAALGDMLELGPDSPRQHAALVDPLRAGRIALVFTAGPLMAALHEALPADMRGAHADNSAALARLLAQAVGPGDVVTVKGSQGAGMGRVVEALLALDRTPRAVNG
jgi:UDP-N-acetylmuramoyl-tripeptide--D-alanyl-D-alanine ligase